LNFLETFNIVKDQIVRGFHIFVLISRRSAMTKLEELIYSLATVIVRYHDSQPKVNKLVAEIDPIILRKKSREYAIGIVQSKEPKFDQQLRVLIDACTKGYPARKHFLTYILHEIMFLKSQLEKKAPFTEQEFEAYQNQVAQLFIDLRQLLKTQKGATYRVTFSDLDSESPTSIDLSGLINDAWVGNKHCNSGLFVNEEVLGRFHMTEDYTDDEIREIAVSLCTENQNALLVTQLQSQKVEWAAQKQELESQKSTLESQKLQLESDKSALASEKLQLESQKPALESEKLHVESQKSAFEAQKLHVESQRSEIETQKQQIKSQRSTIDHEKQQIKAQRSALDTEKQQLKTQKSALDVEKLQVESQKSALGAQKLQLESQKAEVVTQASKSKDQQATISSLKDELVHTQDELEKARLELQALKEKKEREEQTAQQFKRYPAYSPFFGLSGLGMLNQNRLAGPRDRFFPVPSSESISSQKSSKQEEDLGVNPDLSF
jgi:myosin heavy subunit